MGSRYYTVEASELREILDIVGSKEWSYLSPSKILNKEPTQAIIMLNEHDIEKLNKENIFIKE